MATNAGHFTKNIRHVSLRKKKISSTRLKDIFKFSLSYSCSFFPLVLKLLGSWWNLKQINTNWTFHIRYCQLQTYIIEENMSIFIFASDVNDVYLKRFIRFSSSVSFEIRLKCRACSKLKLLNVKRGLYIRYEFSLRWSLIALIGPTNTRGFFKKKKSSYDSTKLCNKYFQKCIDNNW